MKQNTGTNMPRPQIWDEAFELIEQFDANVSEPGEQDDVNVSEPEEQVVVNESQPAEQVNVNVSEPDEQVDLNVSEPEEQVDVNVSEPEEQVVVNVSQPAEQIDVNVSEPEEQEIAFREITEESSPEPQADSPDTLQKSEVSLKSTDVPYELHKSGISLRSADVPDNLNEKEVSLRKGETNDLITIDLETMDFDGGKSRKSARELYYETQKNLLKSFHLIKDEKDFSIDMVFTYAGDMASHIKEKANSWMQLLYKIEKDTAPNSVMHIVKHSLDTAIIAIRIGIGLKLRDEKLELLAMQSCLHDAGMLKLPPELILKQGKLPRKEIELIRKHPEYGHEILLKYEEKFRDIAEIAYQVHERYDGSGYPKGNKGKDIPEHSLIIGIADMFAALLHPRPYRPRRLPFEAIKEIIAVAKEQFPKHIIRALVNEFSAFPEGLYVKLNSEEIGKVITVNRLAPLSPVVEILYNGQGKLKETKIVDLMKDHCLYIASGFYGEEE
jgi:HD-GYP domain-containing protein (c-di-GMP phosphodiesterase class II)